MPCIRGILCPRVTDLRAIYENRTKTLRLYSQTIADLLKHDSAYDKLYLEFGELIKHNNARAHAVPTAPRNTYSFSKSPSKEHSMLSIEVRYKFYKISAFLINPKIPNILENGKTHGHV